MTGQLAPLVGRCVGVGIEVDDPDAAGSADLGDRPRGRAGGGGWGAPPEFCAPRTPRGPTRAPGRCVTRSSNGAPTMATSTFRARISAGSVIHGRLAKVVGPAQGGGSRAE